MLTLSGEAAQIHRVAFSAGFLTAIKKMGWIVATVHGRVSLVFKARSMRSLFVQEPPPSAWRQFIGDRARDLAQNWPRLGTIARRLGSDVWRGMGNLYAILGWFSLIFIEGEFIAGAWEQIEQPLEAGKAGALLGTEAPPLIRVALYTLLRNPEAVYWVGMAVYFLPAYWLYTKLSDHHVTLPADTIPEGAPTIAEIDWLLQPDWQWFWDELLAGCKNNDQKYLRLQAVMANLEWLELTCKHLNVPTSEQKGLLSSQLAFRPIQPRGWFAFLKSQEKVQYTEKAQQVISGYLKQLDAAEPSAAA